MILDLELSIASGRMVDEDFEWQARRSNREFTHTVSSTIVNELTDDKTENARERTTGSPNSLKLEPPSRLSPASGSASRLGPPSRFSTLSDDPELQAYLETSR